MPTPTILSHRTTQMKTVAPRDPLGYSEGFHLKVWTSQGSGAIELDRAETQALLRVLPQDLLLEALTQQGQSFDPAALEGRLAGRTCLYCGQPESAHVALDGGLLCPRAHGGNGTTFTPVGMPEGH